MTDSSLNGALVVAHRVKLTKTLQECVERLMQRTDDELLTFMREQNASLIKFLEYENRHLAVLAGEKVEPAKVEAEGVLIGTLGGGM